MKCTAFRCCFHLNISYHFMCWCLVFSKVLKIINLILNYENVDAFFLRCIKVGSFIESEYSFTLASSKSSKLFLFHFHSDSCVPPESLRASPYLQTKLHNRLLSITSNVSNYFSLCLIFCISFARIVRIRLLRFVKWAHFMGLYDIYDYFTDRKNQKKK